LSLAGAALDLHPMAEGICHDALSSRASTFGRGSFLFICVFGRDGRWRLRKQFGNSRSASIRCGWLRSCSVHSARRLLLQWIGGNSRTFRLKYVSGLRTCGPPRGLCGRRLIFIDPPFPSLPAALVRRGNITHSRGVIILTATCLVPQAPVAVKLRVSTSLAELSIR
jgi:hypothetical protein